MSIKFTDKILDNVHGFIDYTDAEKQIMDTLLFKRLQSIKQLSIANWIFPGSEHTRYIHSLGVMFIADKMAKQLQLNDEDRKIIRMAGLLHDIGHYPLSHVCETPYRNNMEDYDENDFASSVNSNVKRTIDMFSISSTKEFMKKSVEGHHEAVGASIIRNNKQIRDIVVNECGEQAIDIICDMITGNVERKTTNPLWVQILHSELDADGIDYMMRDAVFAGTGFGSLEMNHLIKCLEKRKYNGKDILCINEKGIAAADQYLINKFFSYSQVVFNKHISNLEWMAETIVDWMKKDGKLFPTKDELIKKWINSGDNFDNYLEFTDTYFWQKIGEIKNNPNRHFAPAYIVKLCEKLLNHEELFFVEDSEVKVISKDADSVKKSILGSKMYNKCLDDNDIIVLGNIRPITKNIEYDKFVENIQTYIPEEMSEDKEEYIKKQILLRFMEGICVCNHNDDNIHLLCDDDRSLMKQLCGTTMVIYRAFEFPTDKTILGDTL